MTLTGNTSLTISTIGKASDICNLGPAWLKLLANRTENNFWKDVFASWISVTDTINPKNLDKALMSPLWYNSSINTNTIFYKDWFNKKIIFVRDIINPGNGQILNFEQIKLKFNLKTHNYIEYYRLRSMVNSFISKCFNNLTPHIQTRPIMPFHLRMLFKNNNTCSKTIYRMLNFDQTVHVNKKWDRDLNVNIDMDSWKLIYKICFSQWNDNMIVWFQYRILTRCIGVKKLLKQMNIVENSSCRLCQSEEETIQHLFADCEHTKQIWKNLQIWIRSILKINIQLTNYTIIMGYQYQDQNFVPINTVIMKTKYYIFCCAKLGQSLNFKCLEYELKKMYKEREVMSRINSKQKYFQNVWGNWDKLLSE